MKERDFVQHASIQFLPQTNWDIDKAIRYAEKLWKTLQQRGLGDTKPSQAKDMINYYQQLSGKAQKQFDQFWQAFDLKQGKQRAAMRWEQLGDISQQQQQKIVNAAKQTAAARKNKPDQTPIMAEGWLSQLRFDDFDQSSTEKDQKKQSQQAQKIRALTSELNHAKNMASLCNDQFWIEEVERAKLKLKKQREQK